MNHCLVHEAEPQDEENWDPGTCQDCRPHARNTLANYQLDIDFGFLNPEDTDDLRARAYHLLSSMLAVYDAEDAEE